jgi:3-isopropylmalate/(R)-2-methylmalate dehydratase large subunit
MLGVLVTGEIWLKVPHTIAMDFAGRLQAGVSAKDIMLFLIGRFGLDGGQYQAVEYRGEAVRALPMQERMTLCNMTAELGGQTGLISSDETTAAYLETRTESWESDPDAAVLAHHRFNASDLAPQVAAPHSPANTKEISFFENIKPSVAYIGACTGAKLDDLRAAAQVVKGRRVATGVQLLIAPASVAERGIADRDGTMAALVNAGATVLPSACGACAGYGGAIPEGSTVISSTARNFKGRMGATDALVYLGSPYTVAASALRGAIADPRELLA